MKYSRFEKLGTAGNSDILATKGLLKKTEHKIDFEKLGSLLEENLQLGGFAVSFYDATFWGTGSPEFFDLARDGYRLPYRNNLRIPGLSNGGNHYSPVGRVVSVGLGVREKRSKPVLVRNWGTETLALTAAGIAVGAVAGAPDISELIGVYGLGGTAIAKTAPYFHEKMLPKMRFAQEYHELTRAHDEDVVFDRKPYQI